MNDLEQLAIQRIQAAAKMSETAYKKPLICTYSGGKDSDVLLELFKRSGIAFEVMHNHTTVDAPETVYHVREKFKALEAEGIPCVISPPRYKGEPTNMWELIPKFGFPPTRLIRYCCKVLKEKGGKNRFIATGVRWAESSNRKRDRGIYEKGSKYPSRRIILANDNDDKRLLFENCRLLSARTVNPIVDWKDDDVWDFIRSEKIVTNPLYAQGNTRVGCIGCPMAGKHRWEQFARYPKYKDNYIRAFDRMVLKRKAEGKECDWNTGEEVFRWWMEDKTIPGQIEMDLSDVIDGT